MIIGGWRGPGWRIVDADPGQARQIRDWVRSAITRHGCPVDPADAALVASELYANAVMHGPAEGRVLVGYCLWPAGARVVVCDGGGPGTPQVHQGSSLAEGGRGLQVVDSIAARWGSFLLLGARAVWCDFGQPLHIQASDAWAWLHCVLSVCSLTGPDPRRGHARGSAWPTGRQPPLVPVPRGPASACGPACDERGTRGTRLVADDLYLLAHSDVTGKPLLQPRPLSIGLAGGLLAELALGGSIGAWHGGAVVAHRAWPGDGLARRVRDQMSSPLAVRRYRQG